MIINLFIKQGYTDSPPRKDMLICKNVTIKLHNMEHKPKKPKHGYSVTYSKGTLYLLIHNSYLQTNIPHLQTHTNGEL
jgi:hypothetical protein